MGLCSSAHLIYLSRPEYKLYHIRISFIDFVDIARGYFDKKDCLNPKHFH